MRSPVRSLQLREAEGRVGVSGVGGAMQPFPRVLRRLVPPSTPQGVKAFPRSVVERNLGRPEIIRLFVVVGVV
jgi:hypothetical protein